MKKTMTILVVAMLAACVHAQTIGLDFQRGDADGWNEVSKTDLEEGALNKVKAVDGEKTDVTVLFANTGSKLNGIGAVYDDATVPTGLRGINGYLYDAGTLTVTFNGLEAGMAYDVFVLGSATAAAKPPKSQTVTLTGKETVSFTQTCPDVLKLAVNDQTGAAGQPLSSYKKSVAAADDGSVTVAVSAIEDNWRVAGIAIEKAGE
jgi:hypothetical protein